MRGYSRVPGGVRDRDLGNGDRGRTHSSSCLVSSQAIDWGSGQDIEKQQWEGVFSRVPGLEKEMMGRGALGGRIFCAHGRRPDDSGCGGQVYQTSSRSQARACAAFFEAALKRPRGLPRGIHWRETFAVFKIKYLLLFINVKKSDFTRIR